MKHVIKIYYIFLINKNHLPINITDFLLKQARKGFRPVSARWVFYGFSIKTAFIGISFVCTARYGFQH